MHLTLQGQHEHDEEMGLLDFGDGNRDGNRGRGSGGDYGGNHSANHSDDDDNVIYPEEFRICEVRLVSELSQNREQYIGEEFFTLSFCPNYISYNIDRIRAYTHEKDNYTQPQPGAFVAMSAAIHWGLRVLIRSDVSKKMLEVKKAVVLAQGKHPWVLEHLDDFFGKDPISLPNESGAGGKKRNIKIPRTLGTILAELSKDLGCSKSNIALIAMLITLSEQPQTIPQHAKIMANTVDMFFKRLEFRTKVARLILEM